MSYELGAFLLFYLAQRSLDTVWNWAQVEILNRFQRRGLSKNAESVAHAFDLFSSRRVNAGKFVLKGIGRIPRAEISDIQEAWSGGLDCILLVGDAGCGKSGIAHNLAQILRRRSNPVLFVDAADVPPREEIVAYLDRMVPTDLDLISAFSSLGQEHECYFIVDQLDSLGEKDELLGFTNAIHSIGAVPGVRILATCRTYEAEHFAQLKELQCTRMTCDELQDEESLRYLERIGFQDPPQAIQDLSVNLLNLSLIADIHANSGRFGGIESEVGLWVKYVQSVADREGTNASNLAMHLASQFPKEIGAAIESPLVPNSSTRKLLSRGILVSRFGRGLRFRHERLRDFLCAYALLSKQPSISDLYGKFGDYRARSIVIWFHSLLHHFDEDREARFVDQALTKAGEDVPFYTRAAVIDVLREQSTPSATVVEHVMPHIKNEVYDRYFFSDLANPGWLPALHTIGFFYHPPEPVETEPGYFRFPIWSAGAYLVRLAEHYPDVVVDVACKIRSRNAPALAKLLEGLIEIPAQVSARAAKCVAEWAPLFRGAFDPVNLGNLMGRLTDEEFISEALYILDALTVPFLPQDAISERAIELRMVKPMPSVDDYWLKEIWTQHGMRLIELAPTDASEILENNLVKAIELEQEAYGADKEAETASYWRPAIEPHLQNSSSYPLHNLLVDGLSSAIEQICLKSPDIGELIIQRYLSSNHSILRRIAVYTLAQFGTEFDEWLKQLCSNRANLDDSAIHHEYFLLLSLQFPRLPADLQRQLVTWLFDGPEDTSTVAEWILASEGAENLEQRLTEYRSHWVLRHVWSIREYLIGDDKKELERLVELQGEPDHPDFLSWSSEARGINPITPITEDEFGQLPLERIVEIIKDYEPPSPSIEHSRDGLAEALSGAVKANPERFIPLSALLEDMEIRFIYTARFLGAIRELIGRNVQLELDPAIRLCRYVLSQDLDPYRDDKDRFEAGLVVAQMESAGLVEALLKQDQAALNEVTEERIQGLILLLLENPDPDSQSELDPGWDPSTRSLNCIRGMGMHNLIHYASRRDKIAKESAIEGEHQPQLDPFVQAALDRRLDKSLDNSLAVHSVYGRYFPFLNYLDREWSAANLQLIFPEDPELETFLGAAWDAYVSFNTVYKRPFSLLGHQYHRAISRLGEPEDTGRIGATSGERLGQHLALAYIHGIIDIDSKDGLIGSFYELSADNLRGHVAFWMAKSFGEQRFTSEKSIWDRMWGMMKWRIDVAAKLGQVDDFQDEVSSFMRWLESAPVPFVEMEPILRKCVPFLKAGFYRKLVAEYLSKHAEEFPRQAIEIIHQVVLLSDSPWLAIYQDELDEIIRLAIRSKDESAIQEAIALVNLLGERGDFRWKKHLPGQ